jgi:hypothetical protein
VQRLDGRDTERRVLIMRRPLRRLGASFAAEGGFTLVEMLTAMIVGLMVVGTGVTVFTAVGASQPGQVQRGATIQQSRNTMERLTREIRQGSTIYPSTQTQLKLLTHVHGGAGCGSNSGGVCQVTYNCTSGSCTRVESPPPGNSGTTSSPVTVVSGLSASDIFRYGSSCNATATTGLPGYVCVTLTYPAGNGDDALTLKDGAAPINPTAS